MITSVYKNWIAKTRECGFTNEQACGLAMLYAWTLTHRTSANEELDTQSFWTFVEKDDFDQISKSFRVDDFLKFVPEIKLAGEMLRVSLPSERKDSFGASADLLNLEWPNEPICVTDRNDLLLHRHRFDMLWCQRAGECLREEIRTPRHAYAFASYVTHGFQRFDPEGFASIFNELIGAKSPLVLAFCGKGLASQLNGFEGYEPIQIVLLGFLNSLKPDLTEALWNLQRVLFYKQPGGKPINLDKQFLPTPVFIEFAAPVLTNFITINKGSYLMTGCLIASEYAYRKSGDQQLLIQLHQMLEERYKLSQNMANESLTLRLLLNAVAFYTLCCIHIKNLTNQIGELPSLRMADDIGFLWSRNDETEDSLREEAFLCFNVMLSWTIGPAWALFLENEDGFTQRAYLDGQSSIEMVDDLFTEICVAYQPVRCVVAFLTGGRPVDGDESKIRHDVAFLQAGRDGIPSVDLFQCSGNADRGQFLGEYVGHSDNERFTKGVFDKVQNAFRAPMQQEHISAAQESLLGLVPSESAWQFNRVARSN